MSTSSSISNFASSKSQAESAEKISEYRVGCVGFLLPFAYQLLLTLHLLVLCQADPKRVYSWWFASCKRES